MRFRHAIVIDKPESAAAAFALLTNLDRLAEWHPEMSSAETLSGNPSEPGHRVRVTHDGQSLELTLTAADAAALSASITYSGGFTLHWLVQDHGKAGCLARVEADLPNSQIGDAAEQFRGALLRDLDLLKRAVSSR